MYRAGYLILSLFVITSGVYYVDAVPLRLVNGTGPYEGRLEVYVPNIGEKEIINRWGTVNVKVDSEVPGSDEAEVVCRQLGYLGQAVATNSVVFGPGSEKDPVNYFPFSCPYGPYADQLTSPLNTDECNADIGSIFYSIGSNDHNLDVGIVCNVSWPPPVRLVGGSGPHEGRLEVFFKGRWGTVCLKRIHEFDPQIHIFEKEIFPMVIANSICNQLGFNDGQLLPVNETDFGSSQGLIWISKLNCPRISGGEFWQCVDRWGDSGTECGHEEDLAIICNADTPPNDIRLVDGSRPSEGRVEVRYNGTWGRLSGISTKWNAKLEDGIYQDYAASVICQQLGYDSVESYITVPDVFGPGTGLLYKQVHFCEGYHDYPCVYNAVAYDAEDPLYSMLTNYENTSGGFGIGVVCDVKTLPEVRLVDGPNPNEGRLEMKFVDQWGVVCDRAITTGDDVDVVCKLLGYSGRNESAGYNTTRQYGNGELQRIWFYSVLCVDHYVTEHSFNKPTLCTSHTKRFKSPCTIDNDAAVGISCNGSTPATPIRLLGGSGPYEGRLEVFHDGDWGTVCVKDFQSWGQAEADAVCHQLGYHPPPEYKRSKLIGVHKGTAASIFGESTSEIILLDKVQCSPRESGSRMILKECDLSNWGGNDACDHSNDVGVVCGNTSPLPPPIRLVGDKGPNEGRLEIYFQGEWGTVCYNKELDYGKLPEIVCKQIGYTNESKASVTTKFGAGLGRVWLEGVYCDGSEYGVDACQYAAWGSSKCDHTSDIGIICSGALTGPKFNIIGMFAGTLAVILTSSV